MDSIFVPTEKRRDSLLQVSKTVQGKELVDVLNQLAIYYNIANPSEAFSYIQRAKSLAKQLDYKAGLAFTLKEEGMMAFNSGDIVQSLQLLAAARDLSEEIHDDDIAARSYHCLGLVYTAIGFYEYSLKYYNEALTKYENTGHHKGVIYCLHDEAEAYLKNKQFRSALERLNVAKDYGVKHNTIIDTGPPYVQLGEIYSGLGNDSLALQNYENALAYINEENLAPRIRIKSLRSIGRYYLDRQMFADARKSFEKARVLIEEGKDEVAKADILYELALTFFKEKHLHTASILIGEAVEQAEKVSSLTLLAKVLFTKAEILNQLSKKDEAIKDMTRAFELQDSIYSQGYKTYVADMVASLESEKAEKQISNLNEELETTQGQLENISTLSKVYLAAAIFFIITLVIIIRSQRRLKALAKKLFTLNEKVGKQNLELKKLNDERGDFVKLVAHDMRSPVNNIISITELLKHKGSPEEQDEYILLIEQICSKINSTISKFLGPNAGNTLLQQAPFYETVNMNQLLISTINEYKPVANSKKIDMKLVLPEVDKHVETDKNYIIQIVSNLVSNAIKFSPKGKKIQVSFEVEEEQVVIKVQDEGPGIAISEQKGLFEKYAKTSNKTTANEPSTGLGLAIARQLVETMNGTIELISDSNKGCLFVVRVPLITSLTMKEASLINL